MLYAVPSASDIDATFNAAAQSAPSRAAPSQSAPKGGVAVPAGPTWTRGVAVQAASGTVSTLVAQLRQAAATYHSLPKKKAHLAQLTVAVQQALAAVEGLLRDFPLRNGQTHMGLHDIVYGPGKPPSAYDRASFFLLEWQKSLKTELEFLRALFQYTSPRGKELAFNAFNRRFRMAGKQLLVGLHSSQVHEHVDPRHRATTDISDAMQAWLAEQIEAGENPVDNIIDFLLAFDAEQASASGRSMSAARLLSHKLDLQDGKVWAYYVRNADSRRRYAASKHATTLDVRREEYDSEGGTNTGAANRGADDFLMSDTYVLGPNGILYSFGGETIHSEFFSGAAVRSAGRIVAVAGKVQAIDNRSGHYRPNWKNLLQAVTLLADASALAKDAVIGLVTSTWGTMYFAVQDYIRLGSVEFPHAGTVSVLRKYQREYKYGIPVPASKLKYIAPGGRKNWDQAHGNRWDRFLSDFYPSSAPVEKAPADARFKTLS